MQEVARALEKNGFTVILKTNLSKADFERVFTEFSMNYGQNSENRLFFYYAGHGLTQTQANGQELGHLIMEDTPLPQKNMVAFTLKSISMDYIITHARLTKAKHVLFMFDCCFSGSILNVRSQLAPPAIRSKVMQPVRQFITAGSANETVPDCSVFKRAFLDLLEGKVD